MQRLTQLNTSTQSIFRPFLRTNSNSKSARPSFCSAISVNLMDYAMEHAFASPSSLGELFNVKYLQVNMLAIWPSYHVFLSPRLLLQIYLLSFDGPNFLCDWHLQ